MKTKQLLIGFIAANLIGTAALLVYRGRTAPPQSSGDSPPMDAAQHSAPAIDFEMPPRPVFEQPENPTQLYTQIAAARELAFDQAEATVELLDKNPEALSLLGKLHLRNGDTEGARRMWDYAIQLDDAVAEPHIDLGNLEEKLGNLELAEKHFKDAIARAPLALDVVQTLAGVQLRQAKFSDAAELLERVSKQMPESVSVWCGLGKASQELGEFKRAASSFDRAMQIDANSSEAILGAMNAYRSLGDQARAADLAQRLSEVAASEPRTAENRDVVGRDLEKMKSLLVFTTQTSSNLLGRTGNVQQAALQLHATLNLVPDAQQLRNQLAEILVASGDTQRPVAMLRDFANAQPDDASAWMDLALMSIRLRQLDEAQRALQRVIDIMPDSDRAYNLLAQTQMPAGRDQRAAIVNAQRAVQLSDSAANRYVLATAHYNLGDIDNTRRELKIAIAKEPENPEYREALMRIGDR